MSKGRTLPVEHAGELEALRAVATLELSKGVVVLLGACGALLLLHRDTSEVAESLLRLLHISPDRHFAQFFLDWVDTLTDAKLWTIAGVAMAYACLRFIEAYGLWRARAWAEWFALISGSIYLPFEVYGLERRPDFFHVAVLVLNLIVVLYMAYLRVSAMTRAAVPQQ